MVSTLRRPTLPTGIWHERVGAPSSNTVQAPHWPSPHPYFDPVRLRSSRKTLNKVRSPSASMGAALPLTFNSKTLGIVTCLSASTPDRKHNGPETPRNPAHLLLFDFVPIQRCGAKKPCCRGR